MATPARRRLSLALLLLGALAVPVLTAVAATPKTGHISFAHPTLRWTTSMPVGVEQSFLVQFTGGCPSAETDPQDLVCDHFTMHVDVPASWWNTHHGGVAITVPDYWDGYVYDSEGRPVSQTRPQDEIQTMNVVSASGTYEVRLAPQLEVLPEYEVVAHLLSAPGKEGMFPKLGASVYHGVTASTLPRTRPMNREATSGGFELDFRTTRLKHTAAEPTIGVDRSGWAYVAALDYDTTSAGAASVGTPHTEILRSTDQNRSWESIQPTYAGTDQDSHPATLDPYLYVDKDYGRVFDVDLAGGASYLDYSDDGGDSWSRGAATSSGVNDHQTLFAAKPPPESLPLTLDPSFPKYVIYCVNQVSGSFCNRSLDGGRTFLPSGAPPFPGASAERGQVCGGLNGQGTADAQGRLFLPRGFCEDAQLAISEDGGLSWTVQHVAPGIPAAGFQTAVATDSKGNIYYVLWDATWRQPWLTISRDHGSSWSRPRMIAPPGVRMTNFPSIDAGSAGRIAITFPGTMSGDLTDLTRAWSSYVVVSTDALSANPTFVSQVVSPGGLDDPVHRGDCENRCAMMLDFLDIVIAPDYKGTIWLVGVDTCTATESCKSKRRGGYSQRTKEYGAAADMDGFAVMQTRGPSMRT